MRSPGCHIGAEDALLVGRVELNGKPLTRSWLADAEIRAGGILRFVMQARPNKRWGSARSMRPYSLSTAASPK